MTRKIREGIVVGLIGYASIAAFYAAFDALAARGMLYTVNLLGRAVFRGLRDPTVLQFPLERDVAAIMAYNALHFAAALAVGLLVTWVIHHAEARPARALAILAFLVAGGIVTVVAVGALSTGIRALLPLWSVLVANMMATILAGSYLLRKHPGLLRRFLLPPVAAGPPRASSSA